MRAALSILRAEPLTGDTFELNPDKLRLYVSASWIRMVPEAGFGLPVAGVAEVCM